MVFTKLKLPIFYFNVRDIEERRSQLFSDVRRCFSKWVFLKLSQYSQENTCVGVFLNIKKTFQHRCFPANIVKFLRTPPLAASVGAL